MLRLLKFLVLVFVPALLLSAMFFWLVNAGLRKSKTEEYGKLNELFYGNTPYDFLIIGNSRAMVHIDPKILDSVLQVNSYNMSFSAVGLDEELMILEQYLQQHPAPKYILLHHDFWQADSSMNTPSTPVFEFPKYFPYAQEKRLQAAIAYRAPLLRYIRFLPFVGLSFYNDAKVWQAIKGLKGGQQHDSYYKGFYTNDANWDGTETEEMKTPLRYHMSALAQKKLDSIFSICHSHDIRVLVCSAPGWNMYKQLANYAQVQQQHEQYFKQAGALFLKDYNYEPSMRDLKYFTDWHHLNKLGAEKFSLLLAEDLKKQLTQNHE